MDQRRRVAGPRRTGSPKPAAALPKRFHGTVTLDATRVGRDASRVAEEVIAHLTGLVGAKVTVTLEVEAQIPSGASDHVVRTVTENSRTLKFTSQGFEKEWDIPSGVKQMILGPETGTQLVIEDWKGMQLVIHSSCIPVSAPVPVFALLPT